MTLARSPRNPARPGRRLTGIIAAGLLGAGILSGCGPTLPGAAATVGENRITDTQLAEITDPLHEKLLGAALPAQVNQAVLNRLIVAVLVDDLSTQQGVSVAQGEIDQFVSETKAGLGGQEALDQQLLQSAILPSQINDVARTTVQAQRLGEKLAGPGSDAQVQQERFGAALIAWAESQGVRVSPRFGTWDYQTLTVGPLPTDLAAPPLNPGAALQPQTGP